MIKSYEFAGRSFRIECFDTFPQHSSWYSYEDEADLRRDWWKVRQGDVVLDCGAAFGSWTLCALAAGAQFAYAWSPQHLPGAEPERLTFLKSLRLNGWEQYAEISDSALYSHTGWLNLGNGDFMTSAPRGWSPFIPTAPARTVPWSPNEGTDFLVRPCITLDRWAELANPQKIDFVKVDVEGAEVHVLQGARRTLVKHKPVVIVETHEYLFRGITQDVIELMRSYGYEAEVRIKSVDLSHVRFSQ